MTTGGEIPVQDLGRAPFSEVHQQMLSALESIQKGDDVGKVWLVEHDPVYTAGRATPAVDLGPDVVAIERGGQITFHGPGQLVVYPLLRLPERDVRRWLRRIEEFGVAVCSHFGLAAEPSVDGTGVFVGDRKVASIGVSIRRWVSFHGIAINVAMDLDCFRRIRPCGRDPEIMTDLRSLLGREVSMDEAKSAARGALGQLLG